MIAKEQTWVEFEIGPYKDKILCDVIPMNTCHLLLGFPWVCNRDALYDGRHNSYKIEKDSICLDLTPLVEGNQGQDRVRIVLMQGKRGPIRQEESHCNDQAAIAKEKKARAMPNERQERPSQATKEEEHSPLIGQKRERQQMNVDKGNKGSNNKEVSKVEIMKEEENQDELEKVMMGTKMCSLKGSEVVG